MVCDDERMDEKPHHHGNLREALISAGLELLAKEGTEGLTLRRAAARAGVSHAAPAHHFAGKEGLLLAIAARGFTMFADMMEAERERSGPDPVERLKGICRGYLAFAGQHPALFELIFSTMGRTDKNADLANAGTRAYGVLAEAVSHFELAPGGPGVNEAMVWSLVHGYAGLRQMKRLELPDGTAIPFESILPPMKPRL
jgi:AcrR family transcriptional regulator